MNKKKYSLRIEYIDILLSLCIYKIINIAWLQSSLFFLNYALSLLGIFFLTFGLIVVVYALKNPKAAKITKDKTSSLTGRTSMLSWRQGGFIYIYFTNDYKYLAILHIILFIQSLLLVFLTKKMMKS